MLLRHSLKAAAAAALPIFALLASSAQATPADALRCTTPSQLVNGGFETPQIIEGGQVYPYAANAADPEPGIGWNTVPNDSELDTNSERRLEIWGPDSGSTADEGGQFAEMAMNHPSTLYQDIATVPGTTMHWRLAHRARAGYGGPDVMHVNIGAPGDELTTQTAHNVAEGNGTEGDTTEIADWDESWGHWSGSYTVPADQTTTRFAFAYVSSTSGGGGGNWLDDVVFTLPATACDDSAAVAQNGTIDIDVTANDQGDQVTPSAPVGASHGTVSIVGGKVRYTPTTGYSGDDDFTYTLTDQAGSTDTAHVAVTVVPPPVATAKTSTGEGTAQQSVDVPLASGQTLRLMDGSTPVTSLEVSGKGTFTVSSSGDQLEFQPVASFTGTVPAVTYRITDSFDGSASSTYTVTVTLPAAPLAPARTSTGVGTADQTATLPIPAGGLVRLLDGTSSVTSLVVPDEGSYSLDPDTGVVTFSPELGFSGPVTPVAYRVSDSYEQTTDGTYTAAITLPTPPSAPARTSTGTGVAPQTTSLSAPTGGFVRLLDGTDEVPNLTVDGEGSYELDPDTGIVEFTPVFGFHGTATPIHYRVVDAYGQHTDGTYTPSVTSPAGPTAADATLDGVGTAAEHVTLTIPSGGHVRLLDDGTPVTHLVVAGKGTFDLDTATGVVTFTPVLGFQGTATIPYRATDAYDQTDDAEIAASVSAPPVPTPSAKTSTAVGTAPQSVTIPLPPSGSLRLVDGESHVLSVTIEGKGTYTVDPVAGTISFVAVPGFQGEAPAATYRVTDAYGRSGEADYTATVTAPPAPAPANHETSGAAATPQGVAITVPSGGSITLLDDGDHSVNVITIAGEGTYELNPETGQITFTPVSGFAGRARAVRFAVTDAYGQSGTATFSATVEAVPVVVAPPVVETPPVAKPDPATPAPAVCTRTRKVNLHWTAPKVTLRKITVSVNGKRVRSLGGRARSTVITLQATGPQRFEVQIVGVTRAGAKYVSTRDYRLCNPDYKFVDVKTLRLKPARK